MAFQLSDFGTATLDTESVKPISDVDLDKALLDVEAYGSAVVTIGSAFDESMRVYGNLITATNDINFDSRHLSFAREHLETIFTHYGLGKDKVDLDVGRPTLDTETVYYLSREDVEGSADKKQEGILTKIKNGIVAFFKWIWNAISGFFKAIGRFFSGLFNRMRGKAKGVDNAVKAVKKEGLTDELLEVIKETISSKDGVVKHGVRYFILHSEVTSVKKMFETYVENSGFKPHPVIRALRKMLSKSWGLFDYMVDEMVDFNSSNGYKTKYSSLDEINDKYLEVFSAEKFLESLNSKEAGLEVENKDKEISLKMRHSSGNVDYFIDLFVREDGTLSTKLDVREEEQLKTGKDEDFLFREVSSKLSFKDETAEGFITNNYVDILMIIEMDFRRTNEDMEGLRKDFKKLIDEYSKKIYNIGKTDKEVLEPFIDKVRSTVYIISNLIRAFSRVIIGYYQNGITTLDLFSEVVLLSIKKMKNAKKDPNVSDNTIASLNKIKDRNRDNLNWEMGN